VLEVDSIDRMYLNGYVEGLQTEGGFVHFVRKSSVKTSIADARIGCS
jgi:hypothetical protein